MNDAPSAGRHAQFGDGLSDRSAGAGRRRMTAPARIQSAAAARILGVSQRSVQGLALRGKLPGAARIGSVWTFDADKLAAFVTQRERDAERQVVSGRPPPAARLPTRAQTNVDYERLMAGRYSRSAAY
jgi:hypothetical protein